MSNPLNELTILHDYSTVYAWHVDLRPSRDQKKGQLMLCYAKKQKAGPLECKA